MSIRIMHQAPAQMALLEAAQEALAHLQNPMREKLAQALNAFDGAVVLTTWSEHDFDEGMGQVLSREERAKALYDLHKYYVAAHDADVLHEYARGILAARPSNVYMQVCLVDGSSRYVPASDMARLLVDEARVFHAGEAAAELLNLDTSEIESVDTDVHYVSGFTPLIPSELG